MDAVVKTVMDRVEHILSSGESTTVALAKKAGIHRVALTNLRNGTRGSHMPVDTLIRLAAAVGFELRLVRKKSSPTQG